MAGCVSGTPLVLSDAGNGKYRFSEASAIEVSSVSATEIFLDGVPLSSLPGGGATSGANIFVTSLALTASPVDITHNLGGSVVISARNSLGQYVDLGYSYINPNAIRLCFDGEAPGDTTVIMVGGIPNTGSLETAADDLKRYSLLVN